MTRGRHHALVLLFGALGLSSSTWAACTVSATAMPFGAYNPSSVGATDAVGTVTVTCTVLVGLNLSWNVKMSKGASATYSPRYLSNGAARLNYNIYTNATRTTIWGDGTGSTGFVSDSLFLTIGTTVATYNMYGRIPPLQDVKAGAYSDAIIVTVTY